MFERRNIPSHSFKKTIDDIKIANFNFLIFRKQGDSVTSKEKLLNYNNLEQSLMARNIDDIAIYILCLKE
jgi:hypothetical protein